MVKANVFRRDGLLVPPRSNNDIALVADAVRSALGLQNSSYLPIVKLYEFLDEIVPEASFEVRELHEMGNDHGRTYPEHGVILIREDVYERAYEGEGRDRFTMCHELGHLLLHRGVAFSRIDPDRPPVTYCNSEWQADKFASYLLMPRVLLAECESVAEAQKLFGVSFHAAYARRSEMKNT